MVFSGNKRSGEDMDRLNLKPLHNFDLPHLKWGNQKLLRCMKVDSSGDVSVLDRNHSPEIGTRRRDTEFVNRFGSSSEKVTARINGDGEIEATREKLMIDFQKQVGEMKDAILRTTSFNSPVTTSSNPPAERTWNLRTRKARSPSHGNGDVLKPNFSPVTNDSTYPKLKSDNGNGVGNGDGDDDGEVNETTERPKFSVSISRRELEEDFLAMTGRRLPRKPKKRPRIVQKNLDTLFPGLWLTEITADLYKVPDETETGKR